MNLSVHIENRHMLSEAPLDLPHPFKDSDRAFEKSHVPLRYHPSENGILQKYIRNDPIMPDIADPSIRDLGRRSFKRLVAYLDRIGRAAVQRVLQIIVQFFRDFDDAAIVIAVVHVLRETVVIVVEDIRSRSAACAAGDASVFIYSGVFGHSLDLLG
jgi:hypothetical protein